MAKTAQNLTYTIYVGGKQVDQLTPDQMDRMAERIGEAMSVYYTAHPQEYRQIAAKNRRPNKSLRSK